MKGSLKLVLLFVVLAIIAPIQVDGCCCYRGNCWLCINTGYCPHGASACAVCGEGSQRSGSGGDNGTMSAAAVNKIFKLVDADKNGKVNQSELIAYITAESNGTASSATVTDSTWFAVLDTNKDGALDRAEMEQATAKEVKKAN